MFLQDIQGMVGNYAWASTHISPKELAPTVIAIAVWGVGWAGQRIFRVERSDFT